MEDNFFDDILNLLLGNGNILVKSVVGAALLDGLEESLGGNHA